MRNKKNLRDRLTGRWRNTLYGKIMFCVLAVLITGVFALSLSNIYSWKATREQELQNYETSLNTYEQQTSDIMNSFADYIKGISLTQDVGTYIYSPDENVIVKKRVTEELALSSIGYANLGGSWVMSEEKGRIIWIRNVEYNTFQLSEKIRSLIESGDLEEKLTPNAWTFLDVDGTEIFLFLYNYDEMCCGGWMLSEQIEQDGDLFFSNEDLTVTIGRKAESGNPVAERALTCCDGISLFLTGELKNNAYINYQLIFILFISILCIFFTVVLVHNLSRGLFAPINGIIAAIQKIGGGDLQYRLSTDHYPEEMKRIGENLNEMTVKVREAKLAFYEEQLEKKEIRMQFQNAQIHPHFMLNVINSIYNMAKVGEASVIMEMCRYLSGYMRYIFTQKEMICTLKEEIEHLKEYICIQSVRYPDQTECILDMDSALMDGLIPTMSIHTLVENSYKYGMGGTDRLIIRIYGELDYTTGCVTVCISDNGPGFPPEVLCAVNDGNYEEIDNKKDHGIGVYNSILRFRELYGDEFSMRIRNEGGASVCLKFPYLEAEEKTEEEDLENPDCR